VTAVLLRLRPLESFMWMCLAMSGIGAIGVGVFNEDYIPVVHALFALMAFLFGNLAVIYSSKMVRPPTSYVFVLLGLIGLSALALFAGNTFLGLGAGGMERMIFYPAMFWAIGFGAHLLAEENRAAPVHT
jgi:hypothetical membrane protein